MSEQQKNICPKDGRRCYIKRDKVTSEEVSCRHYSLISYGGVCPEIERASPKTLRRLTFQEVIKLRKITDGTHNPYVYAKWIPEKDFEGLVAELQKLLNDVNSDIKEMKDHLEVRAELIGKKSILDKVLVLLGAKETKKDG